MAVLFLVHGLVVSTWISRIAGIKATLGLSDGALGLALFAAAVGAVTAVPVSGWAIDRFGSKRTVQSTATGFCVSLVLIACAQDLGSLSGALLIYGALTGANDVAINSQAVGWEKRFGLRSISRFHAMFSLGGIVGAAGGGVAASLGVTPTLHFTAAAVAILVLVGATRSRVADTRAATSHSAGLRLRRPPLVLVLLSAIGFCIFLSEGAIADWTAVYLRQILNASEGVAAAGYAAFAASMTIFRFNGDFITSWLGRAQTIRTGGLVAACGLTLVVSTDSSTLALVGFAITGAGFSSMIPVVFASGGRIREVSEATGLATVSGVGYLGFLTGPPLIGLVSELISLRFAIGLLVILSVSAALLVSVVGSLASPHDNPLAESDGVRRLNQR